MDGELTETLGIAGSGTIATGLAVVGSASTDVVLWARSDSSADRARAAIEKGAGRFEGADASRVQVVTDIDALIGSSYLVEAIVEDHADKAKLLGDLGDMSKHASETAILATTTSSLSVNELANASGHPERFAGLHVFNPVPRMALIELVFPDAASAETKERSLAICEQLGKTAVEVPDTPGFVVNRLLFPYLFDAVSFMSEHDLEAKAVDQCMTLGAGLPMGPLALLDFVGLDVSKAIGDSIGLSTPPRLAQLIDEGALGKKAGRGFYQY